MIMIRWLVIRRLHSERDPTGFFGIPPPKFFRCGCDPISLFIFIIINLLSTVNGWPNLSENVFLKMSSESGICFICGFCTYLCLLPFFYLFLLHQDIPTFTMKMSAFSSKNAKFFSTSQAGIFIEFCHFITMFFSKFILIFALNFCERKLPY